MKKQSLKVFYSAARRLRLWCEGVESESLPLSRDDTCYSAIKKPSQKVFYRPRQQLLLGHEEDESEGLLLGHDDVSDLAVMVSSRKAFYSAVETPPTRP